MTAPLTVRHFLEEDFETFAAWSEGHGQIAPPWDALSGQYGLIVEDDQGPLVAAFLFLAGSWAMVEALASRPGCSIRETWEASQVMQTRMEAVAKEAGALRLVAFVKSSGMVRACERAGFEKTGPPVAQMMKDLRD